MEEHKERFFWDNRAQGRRAVYYGNTQEAVKWYKYALKLSDDKKSIMLELRTLAECGHQAANDVIKALDLKVQQLDEF